MHLHLKAHLQKCLPGIDIEFVIRRTKAWGIKYNVIVHEGADYRKLKMVYKGNLKGIKKQKPRKYLHGMTCLLLNTPRIVLT